MYLKNRLKWLIATQKFEKNPGLRPCWTPAVKTRFACYARTLVKISYFFDREDLHPWNIDGSPEDTQMVWSLYNILLKKISVNNKRTEQLTMERDIGMSVTYEVDITTSWLSKRLVVRCNLLVISSDQWLQLRSKQTDQGQVNTKCENELRITVPSVSFSQ